VARTAITAAAAALSIGWAVETVRPSIGNGEALRLAETLVRTDPHLQRELGHPLEIRVLRVTPRAHHAERGKRASFDLRIRGPMMQEEMVVHARRVDGAWALEELSDIDIRAIPPDDREPVAAR
jgi:hypothetical protein